MDIWISVAHKSYKMCESLEGDEKGKISFSKSCRQERGQKIKFHVRLEIETEVEIVREVKPEWKQER